MLRWINFKIAYFFHYWMMRLFIKTCKEQMPLSWHRQLFDHYMVLVPLDISLLAEKEVLRKVLKGTFPYFQMTSAHEDMFMEEFYSFLMENRRDLYSNLYRVATTLDESVIYQRVKTIELIYRDFQGLLLIENLRSFFVGDRALPFRHQVEMERKLTSVLAVSVSVGWGRSSHSVDT
jgi:hypothetical protein